MFWDKRANKVMGKAVFMGIGGDTGAEGPGFGGPSVSGGAPDGPDSGDGGSSHLGDPGMAFADRGDISDVSDPDPGYSFIDTDDFSFDVDLTVDDVDPTIDFSQLSSFEKGLAAVTDIVSLSNPVTSALNALSNVVTGQTIGDHVALALANANDNSAAADATPAETQAAANDAVTDAIDAEVDAGSMSGPDGADFLAEFNSPDNQQALGDTMFDNNITTDDDTTDTGTGTTDTEADEESLWTQYIDKVMVDLEPSIIGSKDYLSSEAERYTDTTRGLTDQRQTVLDRLTSDFDTKTGIFEPTQTSWGDYQSGKNIQDAQTLASLADRTYDNQAAQAERLMSTAQATDPYLGQMSYLAALESIAHKDKLLNQRDAELILKRYGIDTNAETAADRIEAQEPGWFENILNVGQVAIPLLDDSGAWGDEGWLYSSGDDGGWFTG